jgi:hypothetical protein
MPDWQAFVKLADKLGASWSYTDVDEIRGEMFGDDEEDDQPQMPDDQEPQSQAPADAATAAPAE